MRVVDFLRSDCLVSELAATDKVGILRELAALLGRRGLISDPEAVVRVLLEREALGSTGIGDGIAIPHGKLPELTGVVAAFGRSVQGVGFESMDGEPVHLCFLLLAPENSANLHLKALARIARVIKSAEVRRELLRASDADEIYSAIAAEDGKHQVS